MILSAVAITVRVRCPAFREGRHGQGSSGNIPSVSVFLSFHSFLLPSTPPILPSSLPPFIEERACKDYSSVLHGLVDLIPGHHLDQFYVVLIPGPAVAQPGGWWHAPPGTVGHKDASRCWGWDVSARQPCYASVCPDPVHGNTG